MLTRVLWITALAAALLACACGDDGGAPPGTGDGDGGFDNATLTTVEPADGAVGLQFGEATNLRVRYLDASGTPLPDAPVAFEFLVGTGEDTGGATLSATSALTDDNGVATIGLVAGAEAVNFRVSASAPSAAPATFFVAVSDSGFAQFDVSVDYRGTRDDLASLEVRLYQRELTSCAAVDLRAPPDTVFPRRFSSDFEDPIEVPFVIALRSYSLVVIARVQRDGVPLAGGCVNLGADQVLIGPTIKFGVALEDLSLVLPEELTLVTGLDTEPAASFVRDRGAEDLWDVLACPAGPGQLLLDCAIDALATSDDDPSDCRIQTETPEVLALQGARGEVDENGCRAVLDGDGATTLDQRLTEEAATGGFPTLGDLERLLETRREMLAGAVARSTLRPDGDGLARHRLLELSFSADGRTAALDLTASARPVIEARHVPLALTREQASIGAHGFTLRLGRALAEAFDELGLQPAGLASRASSLGTALADAVGGLNGVGCPTTSRLACQAAGLPETCLDAACGDGATAADAGLAAWTNLLDATGIDLTLSGTAPVTDADPDLVVDRLGGSVDDPTGAWTGTIKASDGTDIDMSASFGTAPTAAAK